MFQCELCHKIKIMKVDSSSKKDLIDKDEIINYQYQILQQSTPQVKPTPTHTNKYTTWDLDLKIKELLPNQSYTLRWIGNSSTAYLQTYAYILLIGSGYSENGIVQFKYTIYKLGRKCLDLSEQKLLVEFLCLIEYSRDRYSFLSKYPQIQAIFVKILQYLENQTSNSEKSTPDFHKKTKIKRKPNGKFKCLESNSSINLESQQLQIELQLQEIYQTFNSYFKFITILSSTEYCCSLKIFQETTIHIVIEKDCYFTVEPLATFSNSSVCLEEKSHMINDIEEIIKDHQVEEVNETQDIEIFQTFCGKREEYQVRESSVVPVQRASQIRKPNQNETFKVMPQLKYLSLSPQPLHNQHIEFRFQEDRIEQDKTFIDQLLTNTQEVEELRSPESPKRGKKKKIQEKMKTIQQMKEALQQVRQRIENKIKAIDHAESLKTERNSHEKQGEEEKSKMSGEKKQKQLVKHSHSNQIKKDRKISCNDQTAFQRKKIEEMINRRKSLKNPPIFQENIKSDQKSKQDSTINEELNTHLKAMYFSPTIGNKFEGPIKRTNFGSPSNNVNVNVNLNINEGFFSPQIVSNQSSFSKLSKFPIKTSPIPSYNIPKINAPRSVSSIPPSRLNNPESLMS